MNQEHHRPPQVCDWLEAISWLLEKTLVGETFCAICKFKISLVCRSPLRKLGMIWEIFSAQKGKVNGVEYFSHRNTHTHTHTRTHTDTDTFCGNLQSACLVSVLRSNQIGLCTFSNSCARNARRNLRTRTCIPHPQCFLFLRRSLCLLLVTGDFPSCFVPTGSFYCSQTAFARVYKWVVPASTMLKNPPHDQSRPQEAYRLCHEGIHYLPICADQYFVLPVKINVCHCCAENTVEHVTFWQHSWLTETFVQDTSTTQVWNKTSQNGISPRTK